MSHTNQDTFIAWLRDAHAFEKKLIPELETHIAQAEGHPAIQSQLRKHVAETEHQRSHYREHP